VVSVLGIIATCGVVVNGALVLTITMNKLVARGLPFELAALEASKRRFRPILLTSLTTFVGLAPMIFETSPQARYLIPMAIALGFGIMFSAAVVLLMMPACHLIIHSLTCPLRGDACAADPRTSPSGRSRKTAHQDGNSDMPVRDEQAL
jgi:multidrug efflux pump subunit AcrB